MEELLLLVRMKNRVHKLFCEEYILAWTCTFILLDMHSKN